MIIMIMNEDGCCLPSYSVCKNEFLNLQCSCFLCNTYVYVGLSTTLSKFILSFCLVLQWSICLVLNLNVYL